MSAKTSALAVPRLEKPSAGKGLRTKLQFEQRGSDWRARRGKENIAEPEPSQFETDDPYRLDPPKLQAAFAAQLIAQIFAHPDHNHGLARLAYGETARAPSLLYDKTI